MAGAAVARRYARALFDLAKEADQVAVTREELAKVQEVLSVSPELRNALYRPTYPLSELCAAMRSVTTRLALNKTTQDFCSVLIESGRMRYFPEICAEFTQLVDQAQGRVAGEIITASSIDDSQVERLRQVLSERTGLDVQLSVQVEPSLLGGVIAKVGDLVFDGSLRAQLNQLRGNLTKG